MTARGWRVSYETALTGANISDLVVYKFKKKITRSFVPTHIFFRNFFSGKGIGKGLML